MKPAVSIVVATHNYGRYLAGALDSALAQTFGDFEIVVVDDGSTDDTAEVILPYLADPRVRYYRTENQGQPAAKNFGIRFARADLIAFLDADDLWLPAKLERQLALLHGDPGLGVVYTRRLLIDPDGRQLEYREPELHRGLVVEAMFYRNFVCFSSALVRRPVFTQAGYFDEDLPLAIDYDLWLRVAPAYRFDYVDEPLVQYRTGHANLSSRIEERLRVVDRIMRRFLDERGGRGLVRPAVIRQARAELYYHMGVMKRSRSRLAALPWHVRALAFAPGYGLAWQGLASLPLPEPLRRICRRALGRPVDWTSPARVAPPDREANISPESRPHTCTPHR
jgi:glycosyltransferase involved in cell wall biosynthesis